MALSKYVVPVLGQSLPVAVPTAMSASETAYGEADRAWELETALQIAPTVPRADEIWSLDLRDAGEVRPRAPFSAVDIVGDSKPPKVA